MLRLPPDYQRALSGVLVIPVYPTKRSISARGTQDRHARAPPYNIIAGIDDLAVKVSSFGTTQKVHDLRRLYHGPQSLAFEIADLVDAVGTIERLHVGINKARQESVNTNAASV